MWNQESVALVIIADVSGSFLGKLDSKMIVNEDVLLAGTIGGGIIEAKAIEETKRAIVEDKRKFLFY